MRLIFIFLIVLLLVAPACSKKAFLKAEAPGKLIRIEAEKGQKIRITGGGIGERPGEYREPRGIALDGQGNVFVADFRNYRIQKFDPEGFFLLAWGGKGNALGQFNDPCGVAIDRDGLVYVADTFNHRVQIFDQNGKFINHFEGGFFAPHGVAVDGEGRVWVADSGNGMVKVFAGDGKPIKTIGKKGSGRGEFISPVGIAIDR
ncbi:MAG: NHL repeat-containing protein, partial [Candidatus Aureabacteria bacterium]|nr:NHL repeat-containing protein [Candidatus Auribacterota bacterium]